MHLFSKRLNFNGLEWHRRGIANPNAGRDHLSFAEIGGSTIATGDHKDDGFEALKTKCRIIGRTVYADRVLSYSEHPKTCLRSFADL